MPPVVPNYEYIGQLSPTEQIAFFNSTVAAEFQNAFYPELMLIAPQIARIKGPADLNLKDNKTPKKVVFPFPSPTGRVADMQGGRLESYPTVLNSLEVGVRPRGMRQHMDIETFDSDMFGFLNMAAQNMRRAHEKSPDFLVADLFRNGASTPVWYNGKNGITKNFWDTGHRCDHGEGLRTNTFDNTFPNLALTEANVAKVIQEGNSIVGPDGVNLGVRYDTLVVPTRLEHDAWAATQATNIVYSNGKNPFPGQAANTAAHGENVVKLMKNVKQIIVYPELDQGGANEDKTWFMLDCGVSSGRGGGCYSFLYALVKAPTIIPLMDARDPNVVNEDRYEWYMKLREGADLGLPQYAARAIGA